MMALVVLSSIAILIAAYFLYGRFISKRLGINDSIKTPACELNDGVDFVPAKYSFLLGQHFSAIAAAGPIVGPILAGLWFGWVPAILWIIIGSIFVGGVHDFASLIASIRHKAVSIGEVLKQYMSPYSHKIFLIFIWLTLVYVIIAFTDITAQTFISVSNDDALGPGVASASIIYLLLGTLMGVILYKTKFNLKVLTTLFLFILVYVIYFCSNLPAPIASLFTGISVKQWDTILLVYCFVASILPMWLLLQPRGYLGGWFLYLTIAISLMGALFGGFEINYPGFNVDGLKSIDNAKMLFPLLFITIACGACSGFHGIVSSGTTSKQIEKESDAKKVGYGSMLLEALVAILALGTVMMLAKGSESLKSDPNMIYAKGIANYLGLIGVDPNVALSFALLAFATFVYDTLDVTTRLGRYIVQELFGWTSRKGAFAAAFLTLVFPFIFLMVSEEKAYLAAWALFGSSNQLLASLVLLAVSVWLYKTGKKYYYALWPTVLMTTMTLWSLILLIIPFLKDTFNLWKNLTTNELISGIVGIVLILMSSFIIVEAFKIFILKTKVPDVPKINVQQV